MNKFIEPTIKECFEDLPKDFDFLDESTHYNKFEKNNHNVEGITKQTPSGKQFIPKCCLGCTFYDNEWSEVSMASWQYCNLNIKFPTKKGSCKKRKTWNEPN